MASAEAKEREPSDEQLLSRHRPLLRYDAAEEYFAQPANHPRDPRFSELDRVHGHVAEEDGRTWLQYWLFFAHNPQDRGVLRTGRHEGDWELFQVGLGPDREAELVTFSQHSFPEGCSADEIEVSRRNGKAPVVYVANGSHALYPHAGTADRPFPDPNDEARGDGRSTRPELWPMDHPDPEWITYEGRWGDSRAGIVPGEMSSPVGPPFQESGAWERPASYHESARPCGADPPGRWWALPAVALALIAVGAGFVLVRRRVRR